MPRAVVRTPFRDAAHGAGPGADGDADRDPESDVMARALLGLSRALAGADDFGTASARLCTHAAPLSGAARIVLGWRARGADPIRPVALSGAGEPEWDAETARTLATALAEAVDQARAVASPALPGQRGIARAQESQRRAGGAVAVVTVPIAHRGVALGALLAEFDRPADTDAIERLHEAGAVAAPWLSMLHARRPGRLRRLWSAIGPSGAAGPASAGLRRAGWAAVAVAAIVAAVLPVDLTVRAPARVEGAVQRTVAAPIRGHLKAVHVRPGDAVRAGDLLAELAEREIELDRHRLASEMAQHRAAASAAMARGERSAMAVSQARVDEARVRLEQADDQLERTRVRAPIDGVVLQGDLAQQVGAPVDRGSTLFVVAPSAARRVIVELDERDLRRVAVGTRGRVSVSAQPWDAWPATIDRVAPAAVALDGRNVFELEARLQGETGPLQAGQRGVALLDVGRGPLALDWARQAGDSLARIAWRWMP